MHLVGFVIRIYHVARSPERQKVSSHLQLLAAGIGENDARCPLGVRLSGHRASSGRCGKSKEYAGNRKLRLSFP